jgi:O-antigen ligase
MLYHIPLKDMLIYFYLVAGPFYMFALVTTRDWPALWIIGLMFLLSLVQFFHGGFRLWFDRSTYYLFFFAAAYVVGALVIVMGDHSMTLLGRAPQERAVTTLVRVLYVVVVFGLFVNFLADADHRTLKRIFVAQIVIGAIIAAFGILQYITAGVFGWGGLTGIEGTSETFKVRSSFFGIGRTRAYRSAAVFQEPSAFGFFLVPLFVKVVLSLLENEIIINRKVHITILGIFVLAILFNFSLTAILSSTIIMLALMVVTFGRSRLLLWVVLFAFGCLGLMLLTPVGGLLVDRIDRVLQFSDVSTLDRLFRVYVGLRVALENPLFGVGPGFYAYLYPIYGGVDRSTMATPLNLWLTIITDVGLIGSIPFLIFLKNVLGRARKTVARNPLVRAYFWSTVSFLLLLSTIDIWYLEVFWFDLAMLVVLASGPFSRRNRSAGALAVT